MWRTVEYLQLKCVRCVIGLPSRSLGRAAFAGLHCFLSLAVAGALAAEQDTTSVSANLPRIATHNNTVPAGVFRNGVLNLNLEIVKGEWYPEAEDGPHVAVYAFAEAGQAPSIPGPLIRVPEGAQIRLRVHNTLAVPVRLYIWNQRPGKDDPVILAANENNRVVFPRTLVP